MKPRIKSTPDISSVLLAISVDGASAMDASVIEIFAQDDGGRIIGSFEPS